MTAVRRRWSICVLLMAMTTVIGCRRNDPPPSHFEDLGDESEALLPTSSTLQDKDIAAGQAQWRPFREPRPAEEVAAVAEATAEGGDSDVEKAVRELVADYNGTLSDGAFDELADFFVVDQADGVEEIAETLSTFTAKLKESVELMPLEAENLGKLISHLVPTAALGLDIGQITVKEEGEAVAALAQVPLASFLPEMPPAADIPREVRFSLGEDDYWYIESPFVPLLRKVVPFLEQSTDVLNSFIAKAGADGLTPETLQPVVNVLKPMIDAMNASGSGEVGSDAGPEVAPKPAVASPETTDSDAEAADGT